ncbi:MAG TPA: Crp/Fnr family transcriptional regulator [Rhizomicrobium sp.]
MENPSTIASAQSQAEHSFLSPLIRKLELLEPLSGEAKSRLRKLSARLVSSAPRQDLLREAEPRGEVRILLDGVAVRFKSLEGRRAILGFLLPGDVDEADVFVEMLDHGIAAISACKLAYIPRPAFEQLVTDFPDLGRGFRRMARRDDSISRVWLTNMGQRAADKQAAHLFCELRARFDAAGMGGPDWFANPLTQEDLADVLGISPVHMNRVMQHLRGLDLIRLDRHVVRFPSPAKLQEYCDFDDGYLQGAMARAPKMARVLEPQ